VPNHGEHVRIALVAQWRAIASAAPQVDLDLPSRVGGWRNREVLAHLTVQPILLGRFLLATSEQVPAVGLSANLTATRSLGELIDASARKRAQLGKVNFAQALDRVLPNLLSADLGVTITSLQGSISLIDYLVTRCVEGVVHGGDLVPPVEPDQAALAIAAEALIEVLSSRAPHLVAAAEQLPRPRWVAMATGREAGHGDFASVLPVMT
jgi:hypothetical protein